ncbi:sulfurtransferase [Microbispora sp. H11081]|uniref:sulfurtransferase n=1 Tax=Microbispora sp. H11081 TaxID=2729107 RepID=UPI0014761DFC|nr:sulfurtransferase [Microbispora sp. H11081]
MALNSLPPLIGASELHALLGTPGLRVVDASTILTLDTTLERYVATPDRDTYLREHIPGAVFADVVHDLSDPDAAWDFTLPSPERFAVRAGALGIGDATHVVVYDGTGGAWATRVWWLLRVFGLDTVSVLDGGLGAWKAEGLPVEAGPVDPPHEVFTPRPRPDLVARLDEVEKLSAGGGCLVNALDEETFRGEQPVNPYPRRGRIPGSANLPFFGLLDPATGRFRPRDELARLLEPAGLLGPGRAVTYCGGGIAATLPAFAAHLAGNSEVAVYDGSLTEWTSDPARPVELG